MVHNRNQAMHPIRIPIQNQRNITQIQYVTVSRRPVVSLRVTVGEHTRWQGEGNSRWVRG